jgi:TolB protein
LGNVRADRCLVADVPSYDPPVLNAPIASTRRTASRPRPKVRPRAGTLAALLVAAGLTTLSACSSDDSESGRKAAATTTDPVTTTAPTPLASSASTFELAFLSRTEQETGIFVTSGSGEDTERVALVPGRGEALRWSPDGARLLLDADGTGDFELYVVDAASGATEVLAPSPSSSEGGAVWSPDGTEVAFFSDRDGGFAAYVVEVASGAVRRLSPPEATGVADLAWSPDGEQLAFSTSSELESDVWLVGRDGSDARKVSSDPGSRQPAWSPDGGQLAVSAQPAGEPNPGIYLLDPQSGEAELVADTEYGDTSPVWQPDGTGLYFVAATPNDDTDGGFADDLYRVAIEDGDPEPVISDPISIESELEVSPDGELIVFSVSRLRDKEVFVANADGSGAIPISRSDRLDGFGTWRPGTGPDRDA